MCRCAASMAARPSNCPPQILDEVGILGKRRRKADAVVTIPGGFDLLQDSLDDLLSCGHDCPPECVGILSTQATKYQADASLGRDTYSWPLLLLIQLWRSVFSSSSISMELIASTTPL